jgi:hypothetical protein
MTRGGSATQTPSGVQGVSGRRGRAGPAAATWLGLEGAGACFAA